MASSLWMEPQPGFREIFTDVLNFPWVKFHPYLVTHLISARSSCCSRADIPGYAGPFLKQPGHISITCGLLGFYRSLMKRGLVVLCQFLWEQQGLKERHQRGSLHPAAGAHMALPFLQRCSFGLSSPGHGGKSRPELRAGSWGCQAAPTAGPVPSRRAPAPPAQT